MPIALTQILKANPVGREKILFGATVVIMCFGFYKSIWLPSHQSVVKLNQEIEALQGLAQNRQAHPPNDSPTLPEIGALELKKQSQYSAWANRAAESPETTVLGEIADPSILWGIRIANLELKPPAREGEVIKDSFQMELAGSFGALGRYIENLENLSLLLFIDNISITISNESEDLVQAKIEGTVYGW